MRGAVVLVPGYGNGIRNFPHGPLGERIEEAKATEAEAIVSACPHCERNFTDMR